MSRFALAGIRLWLAAGVLAICLVLGGRGPHDPVASAICLLASLGLFAYEFASPGKLAENGHGWAFLLLIAATLIPILQIVPLPPQLWHQLPGRDLIIETLNAAGLSADGYHSLTFDSLETSGAVLSMLPALAMFITVSRLDGRRRQVLLAVVLAFALVSLSTSFLPIGQLFDGLLGRPARAESSFDGFFANSNHQADFLLVAVACCASLQATSVFRELPFQIMLALFACILLLSVLETTSRMGFALVWLVLFGSLAMIWRERRGEKSGSMGLIILLAGFLAILAWGASLALLPRLLARFGGESSQELRLQSLPDIIWAIGQYFPAGTGIGTFDQVFRSAERLDQLSSIYMNQAHNEYLQVLLEAGLAGGILLTAALTWFGIGTVLAWRRGDLQARTASIVLGTYLLHSLVDYPLRTLSHAALLGMFAAMMPIKRHRVAPIV